MTFGAGVFLYLIFFNDTSCLFLKKKRPNCMKQHVGIFFLNQGILNENKNKIVECIIWEDSEVECSKITSTLIASFNTEVSIEVFNILIVNILGWESFFVLYFETNGQFIPFQEIDLLEHLHCNFKNS